MLCTINSVRATRAASLANNNAGSSCCMISVQIWKLFLELCGNEIYSVIIVRVEKGLLEHLTEEGTEQWAKTQLYFIPFVMEKGSDRSLFSLTLLSWLLWNRMTMLRNFRRTVQSFYDLPKYPFYSQNWKLWSGLQKSWKIPGYVFENSPGVEQGQKLYLWCFSLSWSHIGLLGGVLYQCWFGLFCFRVYQSS